MTTNDERLHRQRFLRYGLAFSALLLTLGAAELFLWPAALVVGDLNDPALAGPGIPRRALALHESLSERIEPWARDRIESGAATRAPLHDVPRTEWPIFTAVFYLQATESLQAQGIDVDHAQPAVRAARDLIMDPGHHTWVRTHWGDDYLHDENVFFRSLLIAGLTSYQAITGDDGDEAFLRDQVETLAADLDRSPHGVLQDYPGETYPIDVLAAVAYIRRADAVLGTDHSAFVRRARRAFVSPYDDERGLVRFRVDLYGDAMPQNVQPGRGIGNSWVGIFAPELWPEDAERWYATHEEEFWQDQGWAIGFREYPRDSAHGEWTFEIDAGPVLDGFGTSASAFGVGAARRMGRLDHAYTLSSQMVATSWPTGGGALLLPELFSHPEAPMLGEAALLYFMTIQPAEGMPIVTGGETTPLVWLSLLVYLGGFIVPLLLAWRLRRRWSVPFRRPTGALVVAVPLGGLGLLASVVDPYVGYVLLLALVFLVSPPRRRKASSGSADREPAR